MPVNHKATVESFYDAWLRNDWDAARACLAEDLKFRSPYDDFRGVEPYRRTCWDVGREGLKSFDLNRYVEDGRGAFIRYRLVYENSSFRGAEYLEFSTDGLIESFDVYFGTLPQQVRVGPPANDHGGAAVLD